MAHFLPLAPQGLEMLPTSIFNGLIALSVVSIWLLERVGGEERDFGNE